MGLAGHCLQFFLSPLCLELSLECEVCAMDSEFAGVVQDDGCRGMQLMCHTVCACLSSVAPGVLTVSAHLVSDQLIRVDMSSGLDGRLHVLAYPQLHLECSL
jgi:hypothetical protein